MGIQEAIRDVGQTTEIENLGFLTPDDLNDPQVRDTLQMIADDATTKPEYRKQVKLLLAGGKE